MTTIEGIREVSDFLKEKIPEIFIAEYHSKIDPEMKDIALKADLIISTMKSLGVGADIPGIPVVTICALSVPVGASLAQRPGACDQVDHRKQRQLLHVQLIPVGILHAARQDNIPFIVPLGKIHEVTQKVRKSHVSPQYT